MLWFLQGSCFLPVFLVIWSSCTFIVSYLVALFRHDVDPLFPYISDTGANPPESCIFGLMTFVSACAGSATIYARFKFVEKLNKDTGVVRPSLNTVALWMGMLSCLGMCIVATFQETLVTKVHDAGALLFFVSGVSYIVLQSVMSFCIFPFGSTWTVCWVRAGLALIALLTFFPTVVCANFVDQTKLHRHKDDKDYNFYLSSAVCEWIVSFSFICFFLTYIDDFKSSPLSS